MLGLDVAQQLKEAGLVWKPGSGDRFAIPDRGLDDQVFVLSHMTIEVHSRDQLFRAGLKQRLIDEGKIKIHQDAINKVIAQYRSS